MCVVNVCASKAYAAKKCIFQYVCVYTQTHPYTGALNVVCANKDQAAKEYICDVMM